MTCVTDLERFAWITLAATLLLLATPALAGELFEKDDVAVRSYDVVAYFQNRMPVKGSAEHKAAHTPWPTIARTS